MPDTNGSSIATVNSVALSSKTTDSAISLPDYDKDDGFIRIQSGPNLPFHADFNPGLALGLGYEDLKTIEMAQFAKSIADGEQGEPGFAEALAVANVNAAMMRSWESDAWEDVTSLRQD